MCNLGTRNLGTAELVLTGVLAVGQTGQEPSISGSIGHADAEGPGATAELPKLEIANQFKKDMKWNDGNPWLSSNQVGQNLVETLKFPWALRHAPRSLPGPDSVTYEVKFTADIQSQPNFTFVDGCTVQDLPNSQYPYSSNNPGAVPGDEQDTAGFPTKCTFSKKSSPANTFELKLEGLNALYTGPAPKFDSRGEALPSDWDVIAAGLISVKFTYSENTLVTLTANAPTYAASGA